jgi:hypothetical protein
MITDKECNMNHIDDVIPPKNNEAKMQNAQFIVWIFQISGIPLNFEDWHSNLRACYNWKK